ncbi:hypothetical protein PF005_g18749 [Phytophthora fragariae]|uniref:Uncharacterized protein n=1 Tax=Phytophthora fragariae TaxID=53985 RepID=A0A6A3XRS0_9STRA|nr:hypothetical protein PF003_g34352 [Phytophthora fragariae]KAE8930435.1 hypothetical protein PF009_g19475 [Phytophthora fragariae]KAE8992001.1 hypothetical protein PF011_g17717 [Phytophthora fragariae]KAE9091179.1 hypothetical protein PF010_g18288 [Phytophthora fragariae]KAE9091203.1 hypothetical protein PF007_g18972 [Phytophthora fragariae]
MLSSPLVIFPCLVSALHPELVGNVDNSHSAVVVNGQIRRGYLLHLFTDPPYCNT